MLPDVGGPVPVGGVEEPPCVIEGTGGIPLVRLFSSPGKRMGCWRVKGLENKI